nr:MAG TPA: Protein of unknown function (DUF1804) [Caudoviricetes sp.]
MAHPQEKRDEVRRRYVFENCSLEMAATFAKVPIATARSWKYAAKETGDDWDKVRAAHFIAGGGLEDVNRLIMAGFLVQYQATFEQLNGGADIDPIARVQALGSLADAYNKMVAANKKILPETSELATAMRVLNLLAEFTAQKYPKHLAAIIELLEPFGAYMQEKLA